MFGEPQSLYNFNIKNPIGRGAGSFVCRIVHRQSGVEYAAKIVEKQASNKRLVQRLENEIKIHLNLKHTNVVQLVQHLEDQDNFYLIMELCDQEFYQYVKTKKTLRLSESEVRYYGLQLLQGLNYLHKQNIIHRDLKLGNILIKDQILKIADFGLAVQLHDEEEERSTLCGTPNYISPEIINKQPYGKKTDIWSFGCCLYSMQQGHGPFEQPNCSMGDVLKRVQEGSFDLPNKCSNAFADLVQNLLNLDPNQRYETDEILQHPFFTDQPERFLLTKRRRNKSEMNNILVGGPTSPHFQPSNLLEIPNVESSKENIPTTSLFNYTTFGSPIPETQNTQQKDQPKQKSQLKDLITISSVKQIHRHSGSLQSFSTSSNQMVKQFLDRQKELGSKKLLFGITTVGKLKENRQNNQDIYSEALPKFSLKKVVSTSPKQKDQTLADRIINKLGLNQNKENQNEKSNHEGQQITPIKMIKLKPCKLRTKNGSIKINEDGSFQMEISKKNLILTICGNGRIVKVNKNSKTVTYPLEQLPNKLQKFYLYSKQVYNAIKEKSLASTINTT